MRDEKLKREDRQENIVRRIRRQRTIDLPGGNRGRKARKGLSFVYNTLKLLLVEGFSCLRYDLACTGASQCYPSVWVCLCTDDSRLRKVKRPYKYWSMTFFLLMAIISMFSWLLVCKYVCLSVSEHWWHLDVFD